MIALCRRRLALVWFCLLLAALPRALLPAGVMPQFDGGRLQLSYCVSDDGGRLLKQLGDPSPSTASHAECPYALAQAAALPPAASATFHASEPPALSPPLPALRARHVQHPPRPPSQAPPARIET